MISIRRIFFLLLVLNFSFQALAQKKSNPNKEAVIKSVESQKAEMVTMSDKI